MNELQDNPNWPQLSSYSLKPTTFNKKKTSMVIRRHLKILIIRRSSSTFVYVFLQLRILNLKTATQRISIRIPIHIVLNRKRPLKSKASQDIALGLTLQLNNTL